MSYYVIRYLVDYFMFQNKSFERENSSKKIKDRMNEKRQLFREFPAKKVRSITILVLSMTK